MVDGRSNANIALIGHTKFCGFYPKRKVFIFEPEPFVLLLKL